MTQDDLSFFKHWFSEYTGGFSLPDQNEQQFIELKVRHTSFVCRDILTIAEELDLDSCGRMLAEAVALFHDVGRFPQYAQYKTFRDAVSVNHGRLGADVLMQSKVLTRLSTTEEELILTCTKFHNSFGLPNLEPLPLLYLKMIKDADKLDIWRVFLELYENRTSMSAVEAGPGLPDVPECSDGVMRAAMEGKVVTLSSLRTMNDFKIMQLSWVYDLNFAASLRFVLERDYIPRIAAALPDSPEIQAVGARVDEYARRKAASGMRAGGA